jgi:hypothetical protein
MGTAFTNPATGYTNYTAAFAIGEVNYNAGGMIIHIEAQAQVGTPTPTATALAHEAAYRSVLVFHNVSLNGNDYRNAGTEPTNIGLNFGTPALGRLWIRGGDTNSGEPSVPDFPIARDPTLWRKARLLTPIDTAAIGATFPTTAGAATTNANATTATGAIITNQHIPAVYASGGNYLWFWVTWKLNVNAYIDILAGDLPNSTNTAPGQAGEYQTPRNQKGLYQGFTMATEHFPVIPGRTTVLETRLNASNNYVDGGHGNVFFGGVAPVPDRRD